MKIIDSMSVDQLNGMKVAINFYQHKIFIFAHACNFGTICSFFCDASEGRFLQI